jgi:hypothetical protein
MVHAWARRYTHMQPKTHSVLAKADFSRVVHTNETPALHARLRDVQVFGFGV